ncbi:DUF7284 family protein [Natronorubrum thiooxidans]|uniref:Uncharacterized protein n=1 Tax=Natronorubrum thiooxidans TaxID=308853 RepID=A0A1N7C7P5_9EURY|nr:hypothetical protein [Natronorubrum thiooxidans]SIR59608.1 hypothetical protein SAMN05421752_101171 [Natronorubrum thiooxidans]
MGHFASERGVSTVVDVTLALLLISASVLILGTYLATVPDEQARSATDHDSTVTAASHGDIDGLSATRTTEVLSTSTVTVTYSLEDVREQDTFSEPVIINEQTYTRTDHGSALGLLADAAVTNHRIDGEPVLAYGEEYEDAVDWAIRQALLGTDREFYIVAEWEPYDGAGINGTATAGERPPPTADVSSTTTMVSSGFSAVDADELEKNWLAADDWWDDWIDDVADDHPEIDDSSDVPRLKGTDNKSYAAAGTVIGDEIVDGLFPPKSSQYALEDQGIRRALKVYHYQSMVETIGDFSFRSAETHRPLARSNARAEAANHKVLVGQDGGYDVTDADALAAWIAADIPRAFAEEFDAIDDHYDDDERDEQKAETVADAVAIEDVTITIQIWDE